MLITLDDLRRFAVARSLFKPTTLKRALDRLGFVQADPIRAPARAQDLILRHRVRNYHAGDLERLYPKLGIEEDFFVVGVRIYAAQPDGAEAANTAERLARVDALVDVAVRIYAPLPGPCLSDLVRRLRFAVPQWRSELKNALKRVKQRLSHARVDGVDWYWPAEEDVARFAPPETVRLLTPFDPVVWDRDRFELLWGWLYRFEAYTPAPKRKLGYYAMPLLWRDRVVGWANLSVEKGRLKSEFGYIDSRAPYERSFKRELEAELDRMRAFLSIGGQIVI